MASKKGIDEDKMKDLTDKVDDKKEDDKKDDSQDQQLTTNDFKKLAETPEDVANIVQGVRVAAIQEAATTMTALEMATDPNLANLLTATAQTSTQQQRIQAESKKGDSVAELAQAIAQASLGSVKKKDPAKKVKPEGGGNSVKDKKLNFGTKVTEQEKTTTSESPEYEEMEEVSKKMQEDAKKKMGKK